VVDTTATPATVSNSWGGAVTITGSSASAFQIVYNNVPKDVCMGVVSGATGWTKVSNGTTDLTTFPATAANAATVCNADPVALTFTAS
jgi:hypothetical protein